MLVLGTTKIVKNGPGGRVTLNATALNVLKAQPGDFLEISIEEGSKGIRISKIGA